MRSPTFSIIIPCFNCFSTISSTLVSCLDQSLTDFEIIVVDDGSDQGDVEQACLLILNEFNNSGIQFRYFRLHKNSGVSYARNFGWDNALGSYVCFLDSDDIWHKDKLKVINYYIQELACTFLYHLHTDNPSLTQTAFSPEDFTARKVGISNLLLRNLAQTSCFVVRRDINYRFSNTMSYCEDYDLALRLTLRESVYVLLPHALTFLGRPQLTPGGLSSNRWKMRQGEMRVYFHLCSSRKPLYLLLPILLCFSVLKHIRSELYLFLSQSFPWR